ncbi:8-amino-7-oxononanoate synthase [Planctomicrobium sp. SH661]|uniref:8-amino-7-oxononanoate synthase n=1 Tax=Planctomicrobium sp. SH661 TaxID=3448124 RepID=UPI003F5B4EF0
MHPLDWLNPELDGLASKGLLRRQREMHPFANGMCRIDGRTLWNFAANDYLDLAGDPRLAAAAQEAMKDSGLGARASPLVTGRTHWHVQLENSLAKLKGTEAAILFPTGFAANLGTIPALVGPEDVVFCDRLNHASLIDGCRLSQARFRVYPHGDAAALRKELQKARTYRRRLIVTDSLFSMDGDHAPLNDLLELAEEFDAMLLVDEAHATGVYGARGAGLLETCGIHSDRVIAMGTLSKAIGLQGGFIAGSRNLIDWLWNSARTQVFSTGLSIPVCAAAIAAVEIILQEPQRREALLKASEHVQNELRLQGWSIPSATHGPIIPVIIGKPEKTMQLAAKLDEAGVLIAAIRPPTVPNGTARLRISLSYAHLERGIDELLKAMQSCSTC